MNAAERTVRRVDRFQQRHPVLAFPFAVMQKFGNDQAGALATRVAYHGLFSLFPLLLLLTTVLGFVLSAHPGLRQSILQSALANFPGIRHQLQSDIHPLSGSMVSLAVGIAGTLYGTLGLAQSAESAMNSVWNIAYVEWPNFFMRRVRGLILFAVLGLSALGSTALSAFATAVAGGAARPLALTGSTAIDFGVFLAAFKVLTAEDLRLRDVALGAALAAVFWQVLQAAGSWYVSRELAHSGSTYGFFAVAIALLSWMYLGAQSVLLAAEINVVRRYRLWPRSMVQPPLTDGDRRTFSRLGRMSVRRPEYEVNVRFHREAWRDPLGDDGAEQSDGGIETSSRPERMSPASNRT